MEAPILLNVSQLRSFLGLLNYYGKFLPHLSSVLAPLYVLLNDSSWYWGKEQEEAIKKSKELLISATVLTHFDPEKNSCWLAMLLRMESGPCCLINWRMAPIDPSLSPHAVWHQQISIPSWRRAWRWYLASSNSNSICWAGTLPSCLITNPYSIS